MPLGAELGHGQGHIVLDGDPAPPPLKGAQPPIFGPCLLQPNGWMDQDATWCGGRPRPMPHCARWGPSSSKEEDTAPQFSAHVCCGQMAGWIKLPLGMELRQGHIALDGNRRDPAPPGNRGTTATFRPIFIVTKRSSISAATEHL